MCKTHFNVDACSFYKCDYKCEGIYFDKMMGRWIDLPGNVQETSRIFFKIKILYIY